VGIQIKVPKINAKARNLVVSDSSMRYGESLIENSIEPHTLEQKFETPNLKQN